MREFGDIINYYESGSMKEKIELNIYGKIKNCELAKYFDSYDEKRKFRMNVTINSNYLKKFYTYFDILVLDI